ncbi:MAG: DEAD/DEAH box helicase [bacterium]|nr:DEAD/DEAH box helicase [bacterium]
MENFYTLQLPQPLLLALEKMKFDKPTPVQAQSIPAALEGRDILGSAQTGTGKTAAFAIPMIAKLLNDPKATAIIMTPTRELAAQVLDAVKLMLSTSPQMKTALLIGGQSMFKQLQQLRSRARIIIGTPGRINDHLQQGSLNLATTSFLVLDETDRMLDMGFGPQIDRVVSRMPKQRQTLLFSATLPPHIVKVSQQYTNNPLRVSVGEVNQPIRKIKQEVIRTVTSQKYTLLMQELRARSGSVIIFVKTKRGADRLALKLNADEQSAAPIHGNLNQNQRNRVIQAFRDMKHRIMVATDVAARGLDIPHIEHVINYDLPQVAEDYIHRIGRTARNGAEGSAVCFITPDDHDLWRDIQLLLNPSERPARKGQQQQSAEVSEEARDEEAAAPATMRKGIKTARPMGKSQGARSDRKRGEYAQRERMDAERRFGEGKRDASKSDRPQGERKFGDKPRGDRNFGDRKFGDKKFGDRKFGDRPQGDRPQGERKFNDRPARNFEDRPARNFEDRPARNFGDRPERAERSERPRFDRNDRNDRPQRDDRSHRHNRAERSFGEEVTGAGASDFRAETGAGPARSREGQERKFLSRNKTHNRGGFAKRDAKRGGGEGGKPAFAGKSFGDGKSFGAKRSGGARG